jgi:hypothetical protein
MSAKSAKSTIIQSKVTRTAHLKAFWTQKIGLTGMGTYNIQMTAKMIAQQTLNLV